MKTFTDIVESKLSNFFSEIKSTPHLAGFITDGFPTAISSYLSSDMFEGEKASSELVIDGPVGKIMKFSLNAVKKGDSIAFVPEFEMLEAGKEFINSDEVDFDSDTIENFGRDLVKNERFIKCLKECFGCSVYLNGEWKETTNETDETGLVYEVEEDVAVSAASVILSIIEVLCNNKDASTEITFEVPGLGVFKVAPVKGGYSTTLTFDKEFKANCKSDKLADKIGSTLE